MLVDIMKKVAIRHPSSNNQIKFIIYRLFLCHLHRFHQHAKPFQSRKLLDMAKRSRERLQLVLLAKDLRNFKTLKLFNRQTNLR